MARRSASSSSARSASVALDRGRWRRSGWSRSCPRPAGWAARSARGTPPTATWARPSRRRGWPAGRTCRGPSSSGSTPIQMVGTPAATVTRSSSIRSAMAWRRQVGTGHHERRRRPPPGVGEAPGVGVEHRHDRAGSTSRLAGTEAVGRSSPPSCAGTSSGGCRRRPWGCPWCRSCSTSTRPGSRRRPCHSTGVAAASSVLVVEQLDRRRGSGTSPSPSSMTTMWRHRARRCRQQRPQQAEQRAVDEDHLVLGVVDDVGDLLGEQADVERVQHPAGAGRREVQLEVAGGVPGEGGHPAVGRDAEVVEHAAQAAGPRRPTRRRCARSTPSAVAVTISLSREQALGPVEEVGQRERTVLHQALHGSPWFRGGPVSTRAAGSVGRAEAATRPTDAPPHVGRLHPPPPPRSPPTPKWLLPLIGTLIVLLVIANNVGNMVWASWVESQPTGAAGPELARTSTCWPPRSRRDRSCRSWSIATLRLLAPDPLFYARLPVRRPGVALGTRGVPRQQGPVRAGAPGRRRHPHGAQRARGRRAEQPVCLLAGVTRFPIRRFIVLNVVGTIGRVLLMRWIGMVFEDQIEDGARRRGPVPDVVAVRLDRAGGDLRGLADHRPQGPHRRRRGARGGAGRRAERQPRAQASAPRPSRASRPRVTPGRVRDLLHGEEHAGHEAGAVDRVVADAQGLAGGAQQHLLVRHQPAQAHRVHADAGRAPRPPGRRA